LPNEWRFFPKKYMPQMYRSRHACFCCWLLLLLLLAVELAKL
jgi:hypothetical protein